MQKIQLYNYILAGAVFVLAAGQAAANGHIDVKNCSQGSIKLCVYDWDDGTYVSPRQKTWIGSGSTSGVACRKSWTSTNAPGCRVRLQDVDTCDSSQLIGKMHSGPYTVWTTHYGSDTNYLMDPGTAANCAGGSPSRFTLSGSEISGCVPRLIIYDAPYQKSSYVLKNRALSDMRQLESAANDSVWSFNDRFRGVEVTAGKWEVCKDVNYNGSCMTLTPANGFRDLQTYSGGEWDRQISSIRPLGCN